MATIQQDEDEGAAERECSRYTSNDPEGTQSDGNAGENLPARGDEEQHDKGHSEGDIYKGTVTDANNSEADIIPLQHLGVCDTDLSKLSTAELATYALAALMPEGAEGGYAVQHSKKAVSDFGKPPKGATDVERAAAAGALNNPMTSAFPGLFPYREGGFESVEDLKITEEEEQRGISYLNPGIKVLRKHLHAMGRKVLRSDHAQAAYQPRIWGTTIAKNPASLWMTINPVDLHDLLMHIFAGNEINMDTFDKLAGPDAKARARNTLFNIESSTHKVNSKMGFLGEVEAYFGIVEAQGCGTLHLHILIWLKHTPTVEEMQLLLHMQEFRDKLAAYIKANIRAHLDSFTEDEIKDIPQEKELAYSHPPDPKAPDYKIQVWDREHAVVRSQQVHTCTTNMCLNFDRRTGKMVCK
ncbi:hypothetical protein FRB95_012477 [Tulasnella sp. JGI-2019a]|nr:hypothetical protein FRB95_012477 [Tulasnella sp. JGI-2019a]